MITATTAALEFERRVRCRPETLFSYFTDPVKHCQWQGKEALLDPRPGGAYQINVNRRAWIRGEYLVVDPPHRLVISWGYESEIRTPPGMDKMPPGSTTLEITLVPDGEHTVLRLRHANVPPGDAALTTRWAWDTLLMDRLATLAEGGAPGRDPFPTMTRIAALIPTRLVRTMARAISRHEQRSQPRPTGE